MPSPHRLLSFFRNVTRRKSAELDLDAEVRSHLDLLIDEKVRNGMSRAAAERAARIELGGVEQVKEQVRSTRAGALFATIWQDVRFGVRQLRRNPGFTAVAVVTLALGIGANTAIFSVVDATLLDVIPYPHPETIISASESAKNFGEIGMDWPALMDWKQQNHVFEYLGGYHFAPYSLTGDGEPIQVRALQASRDYYRIAQTSPELGRLYTDAEDSAGAEGVALLSHNFWRNQFGGAQAILGKSLTLNGKPYSVIGVMPAGFWTREPADIFVPIGPVAADAEWQERTDHPALRGIARLKPGVTLAAARADIDVIARRLEQQYPLSNAGETALLRPLRDDVSGDIQPTLFVLLAAVAFVLLTACANVANLLLARSSARQREMAIRAALGAARSRLVRQTLVESLLLGLLGGGLGILLAVSAINPLLALAPRDVPGLQDVQVNAFAMLVTLAISVFAAVLFGIVPALEQSRAGVGETLKRGTRAIAGGSRIRSAVLATEVALALVLAVGAGLMLRSMLRAQAAPLGFQPEGVLTFQVRLAPAKYPDDAAVLRFFHDALARIKAVPGVSAAAAVRCLPMAGGCWNSIYTMGDRPIPPQAELPEFDTNVVTPEYFKTLGITLIKGRVFTEQDDANAPSVIIVNETLARRMWPAGDALGKMMKQGFPQSRIPFRQVIGIVADVKREGPDAVQGAEAFMPLAQKVGSNLDFVVRTGRDPMSAASEMTREIHAVDKDLPLVNIQPISQHIGAALDQRKFSTLLLTLFGALAVALAAIGTYGVMAYTVSLQMREMSIRIALGAQSWDVMRLVVGNALLLAAVGSAAGLIGSLALTRFMQSLLFEVSAGDPVTFICAALLLAAVAALASYLPARRAMRVDPVIALRCD